MPILPLSFQTPFVDHLDISFSRYLKNGISCRVIHIVGYIPSCVNTFPADWRKRLEVSFLLKMGINLIIINESIIDKLQIIHQTRPTELVCICRYVYRPIWYLKTYPRSTHEVKLSLTNNCPCDILGNVSSTSSTHRGNYETSYPFSSCVPESTRTRSRSPTTSSTKIPGNALSTFRET